MNVIPFSKKHGDICGDMLYRQNIKERDHVYEKDHTFIFLIEGGVAGFFSYRPEEDKIWLTHFILDEDFRNFQNARDAFDIVKTTMRWLNKDKVYFTPPAKDERFNRLIRLYFSVVPFKTDDETNYYLIEL